MNTPALKQLVLAALALATAGSLYAKVDPEMAEKIRRAKERFAAMSPKEQEEYRWKKAMKRFGGWLTKEGSGAGHVAFVDTTSRLPAGWLQKAVDEIEDLVECRMVAQASTNAVTLANAAKELLRTHAGAAVFLVDDPALPSLLVAPESDWAFINLAALAEGGPDEKKFLFRVEKEIWRTFGYLCGAAESNMGGCVLSPVNTIEDLDAIPSKFICPEPMNALRRHLEHVGVKPYYRTTYMEACREGWAHQPTNEYQQAIWDKVHQIPDQPLKLKPPAKPAAAPQQ